MTLDDLLDAARIEDPNLRIGRASDAFWAATLNELYCFLSERFSRADADELVQITLDAVLDGIAKYRAYGPDSFVHWLRVIAARKAKAFRRKPAVERARLQRLTQSPPTPQLSPPSWLLQRERGRLLEQHIPRLPDKQRQALEHQLEGRPDRTLARREGVTTPTVRSRRGRARKSLIRSIDADRRSPR
jgi:RNA polymerase sigma factor (sigma-70 family)